jgi:hypothetical protein
MEISEMKKNQIIKSSILAFCLSVFFGAPHLPVTAQKLPIALKSKTSLSPVNKSEYEAAAEKYRSNPNEVNRDRLIFLAVTQIDLNFREYQRNRRIGKDLFNILMDILEIGATTATSIVNGTRPKAIINYAATFLQGSRASVNKNLHLLELQILFNKMIENRSKIMAIILNNVEKPASEYSFERAYIDVVAYFTAGTMDSALSSLAADTGAQAQNAEAALARKKAL